VRRSRALAGGLRQRLSRPRPVWLGGPLALAVVGFGLGLHHVGRPQAGAGSNADAVLAALMEEPQPQALSQVQSARAAQRTTSEPGFRQQLTLAEPEAAPALALEIRVALLSAGTEANLSATGPWLLRTPSGQLLQRGEAGDPVNQGLARQAGDAWLITSREGALLVNGQRYGGRLRLVPKDQGVQLINHLDLERYIAAVVGSEMPSSWPVEALKAQAVAARSYALAHMARPANRHWHLGDTTRWQAYRGLERVNRATLAAAAATSGLILSYQGGIVESLYAANRQITEEAHGHLGASMSQQGARGLAEEGHRYNAILGRYYPGASLARLRAGVRAS